MGSICHSVSARSNEEAPWNSEHCSEAEKGTLPTYRGHYFSYSRSNPVLPASLTDLGVGENNPFSRV